MQPTSGGGKGLLVDVGCWEPKTKEEGMQIPASGWLVMRGM